MKKPVPVMELRNRRIRAISIPIGIEVHFKDFDIEKYSEDSLELDENKKKCKYTIFGNAASTKGANALHLVLKNDNIKNLSNTDIHINNINKKGEIEKVVLKGKS